MTEPAGYTFVPHFRRGLAADITAADNPADPATGRAQVQAGVTVGWRDTTGAPRSPLRITRDVDLVSPGDVGGLAPAAVLRCHPADGAHDAQPGELAFVEFYDEDLPWRYTPARELASATGPRLRPWLALLVLTDAEFTLTRSSTGTDVLTVLPGTPLPPPEQTWAWAHAQLSGAVTDPAQAGPRAEQDADTALSRIMSPRRLAASTAYTAFLVPAFETGRRAGLGLDPATAPARAPSWGPGRPDRRFPVYHVWRFTTGVDAGFEALVRRLQARRVGPHFGSRELRVDTAAAGIPDGTLPATVWLEGALRPPDGQRAAYPAEVPGRPGAAALAARIDAAALSLHAGEDVGDDPIICPPLYGGRHAGVVVLADVEDGDPVGWVRELNLDPRNRAAAGLGAQVVRDRQEDLMVRAWAQVGHLREANQRLREAELAIEAASTAFTKHLAGTPASRLLLLTSGAHGGIAAPAGPGGTGAAGQVPSVHAAVAASRVPTAAVEDPAFRKLTRPALPLLRATAARAATATPVTAAPAAAAFQDRLVERMDATPGAALSAAPPPPAHPEAVPLSTVDAAAAYAVQSIARHDTEPKRVLLTMLAEITAVPAGTAPPPVPTTPQVKADLAARVAAWRRANPGLGAQADAVAGLAAAITAVRDDGTGVRVDVAGGQFAAAFGDDVAAKAYRGVLVASTSPPPDGKVARMTDGDAVQEFRSGLGALSADVAGRLSEVPATPAPLGGVDRVAGAVVAGMNPPHAVYRRVTAALPGLSRHLAAQAGIAGRRLKPVQAHPSFDEPAVADLQAMSQDHVLPNISALPTDTLTLMEPNRRFIEAFLAGLNFEFARELLWREYPTDQRGSYFRVFWDRRDALRGGTAGDGPDGPAAEVAADAAPLHQWLAPLGGNLPAGVTGTAAAPLVLVMRSDLLHRFSNTVVTAHRASWTGTPAQGRRTPDPAAEPLHPLFTATLEPDVSLFAFALTPDAARGHVPTGTADPRPADPGYFFVLAERPGQPRFGLDLVPSGANATWDDLSWQALVPAGAPLPDHLDVTANVPAPADPAGAAWPATAADLASILLRSPVMYARHADDLLPPDAPAPEPPA